MSVAEVIFKYENFIRNLPPNPKHENEWQAVIKCDSAKVEKPDVCSVISLSSRWFVTCWQADELLGVLTVTMIAVTKRSISEPH